MIFNNPRFRKTVLVTCLLIGIAACSREHIGAGHPQTMVPFETVDYANCQRLYSHTDFMLSEADVADREAARIPQFSPLRVNRFWGSLAQEATTPKKFDQFLDALDQLGLDGMRVEWTNFAATDDAIESHYAFFNIASRSDLMARLSECRRLVLTRIRRDPILQARLRLHAEAVDHYQFWQRTLGLYPASAFAFHGLNVNHARDRRARHQRFRDLIPVQGTLQRYTVSRTELDATTVQAWLRTAARENPFAIPLLTDQQWTQLARHYAPIFEIDTATAFDKPVSIQWDHHSAFPRTKTEQAPIFFQTSFVRWGEYILPQLSYLVWFAANPKVDTLDLNAGFLDGLIFRVTLDNNGDVLFYDSAHMSGTQHQFYPSHRVLPKRLNAIYDSRPFVPQSAPSVPNAGSLIVRVESGSHAVVRLSRGDENDRAQAAKLALGHYNNLRTLPHPTVGSKSLFSANGLVHGTERSLSLFAWPSGVPRPGAMRQWGHHATTYVGKRFFDEPELFETYFFPEHAFNYPNWERFPWRQSAKP